MSGRVEGSVVPALFESVAEISFELCRVSRQKISFAVLFEFDSPRWVLQIHAALACWAKPSQAKPLWKNLSNYSLVTYVQSESE